MRPNNADRGRDRLTDALASATDAILRGEDLRSEAAGHTLPPAQAILKREGARRMRDLKEPTP